MAISGGLFMNSHVAVAHVAALLHGSSTEQPDTDGMHL
jgi:hypothetical protein